MCEAIPCRPSCNSTGNVPIGGQCGAVSDGCGGVCTNTCAGAGAARRVGKKIAGLPLQCQDGTCVAVKCTPTCTSNLEVEPFGGCGPAVKDGCGGVCELKCSSKSQCMFGTQSYVDVGVCVPFPEPSVVGASGCVDLANGAYYCTCGTGYQAVGPYPNTCKDIDGCRGNAGTASDPCNSITLAVAGSCVDIKAPGTGFSCTCPAYTIWNGAACTVNCPTFGRASPLPKDSSFSFNVCPPGKVIAGSVVRTGGIWDGVRLTCNSPLSAGVTGGTDIIVGGTGGMDQTQITTTTGFIKARLTTADFSGTGTTSVSKGYQKGSNTEGGTTTTGSTSATQECPAGQIMVGACCDAGIYMYRFGIVCAPFP
ncbi:hypothetical protein OEZ86_007227 [Tetradesmus obliquus]|nr:hypothetical protein OEZ86_007227 [Tetradesmus obliquus]